MVIFVTMLFPCAVWLLFSSSQLLIVFLEFNGIYCRCFILVYIKQSIFVNPFPYALSDKNGLSYVGSSLVWDRDEDPKQVPTYFAYRPGVFVYLCTLSCFAKNSWEEYSFPPINWFTTSSLTFVLNQIMESPN